MSTAYQALVPEIKKRLAEEFQYENTTDTEALWGLPYPYTVTGNTDRKALYYWDTFFINQALLKFRNIEQARHNVENLIYLYRKLGFIPESNSKSNITGFTPPLLPWMVRDVYRATGDKEWLRRLLPDVIKEYQYWTTKPHTSASGLYRYTDTPVADTEQSARFICSMHTAKPDVINPVDLNAILYRNAKLLYDLQIEDSGHGDENLLQKSKHINKMLDLCWDNSDQFFYDNDLEAKSLVKTKTLAGFMPLFVEMLKNDRAEILAGQIETFTSPGGLSFITKDKSKDSFPGVTGPCIYFIVKGLCDYEYMEDALDIGTNWLNMVTDIYEKTGEFWEWYNVLDKSHTAPNGFENTPVMGWTAGTYIAIMDTLGLE